MIINKRMNCNKKAYKFNVDPKEIKETIGTTLRFQLMNISLGTIGIKKSTTNLRQSILTS